MFFCCHSFDSGQKFFILSANVDKGPELLKTRRSACFQKVGYMVRILFFIFFSISALANESIDQKADSHQNMDSRKSAFTFGAEGRYYRYVEPGLIAHSGPLFGVWSKYQYETAFYRGILDANLLTGILDYDGAVCSTRNSSTTCSDFTGKTTDIIFKITHRFTYELSSYFDLFAGVGFRGLYDKGDGSVFYSRIGQYYFLPVGLTTRWFTDTFSEGDHFFMDVEYNYFLKGYMTSRLSEVNSAYSDVDHEQDNGYGMTIAVGYQENKKSKSAPWSYQLFYEKWRVEDSNVAYSYDSVQKTKRYFVEPKNFTESYGLRVGFDY